MVSSEIRFAAARERYQGVDARLLNAARDEREAALVAYATNDLSLFELLDFERELARAEIQRLRSYVDMTEAIVQIWMAAALGSNRENE